MAIYMVERELPGITNEQPAGAQQAAIASSQKSTIGCKACGRSAKASRNVW